MRIGSGSVPAGGRGTVPDRLGETDPAIYWKRRAEQAEAKNRQVRHVLENIADPYNERVGDLKKWAKDALKILAPPEEKQP